MITSFIYFLKRLFLLSSIKKNMGDKEDWRLGRKVTLLRGEYSTCGHSMVRILRSLPTILPCLHLDYSMDKLAHRVCRVDSDRGIGDIHCMEDMYLAGSLV